MTKKQVAQAVLMLFIVFGFADHAKAEDLKLYISDNTLFYKCPDRPIAVPADLNIEMGSVKILNDNFFVDKNKAYTAWEDWHGNICGFNEITGADPETFIAYNNWFQKDKDNVYANTNYWGWGVPKKVKDINIDPATFEPLEGYYAKDNDNVYVFTFKDNGKVAVVEGADVETFEVLSEDHAYAMDENNMYLDGKTLGQPTEKITNSSLFSNLKGKIILKVESGGEAYYVNPQKKEMYFLSRPVIAFHVMREQGIGITNHDLEKIPVADNYCPAYAPDCDEKKSHDTQFSNQQKGKIFIQVEGNGEAWYVNPADSKRYFLGRPADAFAVMRNLGLGISNNNFNRLLED